MADSAMLYTFGFTLILVGVLVLVAAAVLTAATRGKNRETRAAGVVIVGPVPIIFGSKKDVKTLLTLSVTLTALLIAGLLIYHFLLGR
ncbi:MAG: DUF131 domain-containing protein [Candidatus Bathyarchaeota archaeon]|nr:DUF131 domain-containing protein [Candidatus Bathyarchaeota archaeon]